MNLRSVRWRLPLSYITIALVAALLAGALMLAVLRDYYQQREREYLERNAAHIAQAAGQLIQVELPGFVLADQVKAWSFLLQARVQIFGKEGDLLADSGTPDTQQVLTISSPAKMSGWFAGEVAQDVMPLSTTVLPDEGTSSASIFLVSAASTGTVNEIYPPDGVFVTNCIPEEGIPCSVNPGVSDFITSTTPFTRPVVVAMSLADSFYGFDVATYGEVSEQRSSQRIEQLLQDEAGLPLGRVVFSEGPAYGAAIVASVARTWAIASLIALIVAGGAGWVISRGVTAPVLHLRNVTARMAEGDLTARCGVDSADEFGALGRSFDQMAGRIESLVETLRRFVADAAHELNTPLTALQTNLELARSAVQPDECTHLLEQGIGQIARLQGLVQGLLSLSRLESKASASLSQSFDLLEVVQTLAEVYASRAEQSEVNFELALPGHPLMVCGDAGQLRIAIENLLDNALKFTPALGTVRLSVEESGSHILVTVEDTGIGIPEEDLPVLFKRFHRGRNASAYPGSGLGLAIVDTIARLQGGSIGARNTSQGACFELRLPANKV